MAILRYMLLAVGQQRIVRCPAKLAPQVDDGVCHLLGALIRTIYETLQLELLLEEWPSTDGRGALSDDDRATTASTRGAIVCSRLAAQSKFIGLSRALQRYLPPRAKLLSASLGDANPRTREQSDRYSHLVLKRGKLKIGVMNTRGSYRLQLRGPRGGDPGQAEPDETMGSFASSTSQPVPAANTLRGAQALQVVHE
jgi:hypothetical protein